MVELRRRIAASLMVAVKIDHYALDASPGNVRYLKYC
jgi:hypothetical protein